MNARLRGRITAVHLILGALVAIIIGIGMLFSLLNYYNQVLTQNQNSTLHLINLQGNLSTHSRAVLIDEFQSVASRGGFANHQDSIQTQHLLEQINNTLTRLIVQQATNATNSVTVNEKTHRAASEFLHPFVH